MNDFKVRVRLRDVKLNLYLYKGGSNRLGGKLKIREKTVTKKQ